MIQVIPSRVELRAGMAHWTRYVGAIGACVVTFFLGAAWQNHQATRQAVTEVQKTYQGKLDYHIQNEKVVAKVAKAVDEACNHNLDAAIANGANAIRNCPPVPPVVKAIVSQQRKP